MTAPPRRGSRWTSTWLLLLLLAAAAGWGWFTLDRAPRRVYVACTGSDHVAVLDPVRHEVLARIPTDRRPEEVALGAGGWHLYVSNHDAGTVQVFDTVARRLMARYVVGGKPGALRLREEEGLLEVAQIEGGPTALVRLLPIPGAPRTPVTFESPEIREVPLQVERFGAGARGDIAGRAQPEGRDFFLATNVEIPAVLVTDARTRDVRARIPVGERPSGVVLGPGDRKAYVPVRSENCLAILDVDRLQVEGRLPVGRGPAHLLALPGREILYSMDTDGTTVTVVRTGPDQVLKTLEVGRAPLGAAAWLPEGP